MKSHIDYVCHLIEQPFQEKITLNGKVTKLVSRVSSQFSSKKTGKSVTYYEEAF